MGLDMYLRASFYVKNWEHYGADNQYTVSVTGGPRFRDGRPYAEVKSEQVAYVVEEVGYWRKANHIHKWFVDHCAGGMDECQEIYVSPHKLVQLRRICQLVLGKSKTAAGKLHAGTRYSGGTVEELYEDGQVITNAERYAERYLPTTSGFFFGGTEYNEWYLTDVRHTLEIIEKAEDAMRRGGDIYYQASW